MIRQACASGWGGGKVVQYRSFCASPSATSQNSRKVSCINLCFCRISLFKVCFLSFNPVTNCYFQTRYLHIFTHHRSACAAEVQVQARRAWKHRAFSRGSYFTVFCQCAMRKYTNIIRLYRIFHRKVDGLIGLLAIHMYSHLLISIHYFCRSCSTLFF